MRSLAKTQSIVIKRQDQSDTHHFREAVRRHFKDAVGQEKGRFTCFQLSTARGVSEHSHSLAREAEQHMATLGNK